MEHSAHNNRHGHKENGNTCRYKNSLFEKIFELLFEWLHKAPFELFIPSIFPSMEIILAEMAMGSNRWWHFKALGAERGTSPCHHPLYQAGPQRGHQETPRDTRVQKCWVSPHRTQQTPVGTNPLEEEKKNVQEEGPGKHQKCHQLWGELRGLGWGERSRDNTEQPWTPS